MNYVMVSQSVAMDTRTWVAVGIATVAVAIAAYFVWQNTELGRTVRRQSRLLNSLTPFAGPIPNPVLPRPVEEPDAEDEAVEEPDTEDEAVEEPDAEAVEAAPEAEVVEPTVPPPTPTVPPPTPGLSAPTAPYAIRRAADDDTEAEPPVIDFAAGEGPHTMKVTELRELLVENGVEIPTTAKRKADLIELLQEHNKRLRTAPKMEG